MNQEIGDFWLVAAALPGQMDRAELNLLRQGFQPFIPRAIVGERKKRRVVPLFSRYFFVKIKSRWQVILSTFGVASVIMVDEIPSRVPDDVVTSLRDRENEQGLIELDEPLFFDGQRVQIIAGPFHGVYGITKGATGKDRERVLIELLASANARVSCLTRDVIAAS